MRKHPWLHRRNGTFYLRAIIPRDLIAPLGRREIWKSLRTPDRSVADVAIQSEAAMLQLELANLRKRGAPERNAIDPVRLQHAAQKFANYLAQAREQEPVLVAAGGDVDGMLQRCTSVLNDYSAWMKNHAYDEMTDDIAFCARLADLEIRPESAEWKSLGHYVARAVIREAVIYIDELRGKFTHDIIDPLFDRREGRARPPGRLSTLQHLTDAFWKEFKDSWAPKTRMYYDSSIRLALEYFDKDKLLIEISRDDCRTFRDHLLWLPPDYQKIESFRSLGLRATSERNRAGGGRRILGRTADKYVGFLSTLFRYAMQEGLLERNPAEGLLTTNKRGRGRNMMAAVVHPEDKRRPFSLDELKIIFGNPEYQRTPPTDALRWAPLIALFQGFRLNEILQLETTDISYRENILCFQITDEYTGDKQLMQTQVAEKRIKTKSSKRTVPVHPEIIRLGFLKLWSAARQHRHARLFNTVRPGMSGYYSDVFGKHFRRFLQRQNICGRGTVFHSFRHNFRDAARAARIPKDVVFQIGGWSSAEIGNAYGQGYSLADLLDELRKLQYPGLNIVPAAFTSLPLEEPP